MQPLSAEGETFRRNTEKLTRELGPLVCKLLSEPGVEEISLNEDGNIWLDRAGEELRICGQMQSAQAAALIATVASTVDRVVTPDDPKISCELITDGSRFTAAIPPVVARPIFSIRRKSDKVFTLNDYEKSGIITHIQHRILTHAVRVRKKIIVAGGTKSGKTTFTNALLHEIGIVTPHDRLVIIEDTSELQCNVPNFVKLHTTDEVTISDLIVFTLRLRPDRIIVGEVRGKEGLDLLQAWQTGHEGGISTLHANSAHDITVRLESMQKLSGLVTNDPNIIISAVDLLVFIKRDQDSNSKQPRKVKEILEVIDYKDGKYITKPYEEVDNEDIVTL